MLRCGARYVVVHLDLAAESENLVGSSPVLYRDEMAAQCRQQAEYLTSMLKHSWGPPRYSDEWIQVWDTASLSLFNKRSR
ncbi:MAG: hypothetical protein KJ645_02205 [Planctomycetes bacterium]|nr:hypothetical protein [Planctomycetota bacterium]